jgi:hypothetical protein
MKVEIKKLEVIADNRGWLAEVLKSDPIAIEQVHFLSLIQVPLEETIIIKTELNGCLLQTAREK